MQIWRNMPSVHMTLHSCISKHVPNRIPVHQEHYKPSERPAHAAMSRTDTATGSASSATHDPFAARAAFPKPNAGADCQTANVGQEARVPNVGLGNDEWAYPRSRGELEMGVCE